MANYQCLRLNGYYSGASGSQYYYIIPGCNESDNSLCLIFGSSYGSKGRSVSFCKTFYSNPIVVCSGYSSSTSSSDFCAYNASTSGFYIYHSEGSKYVLFLAVGRIATTQSTASSTNPIPLVKMSQGYQNNAVSYKIPDSTEAITWGTTSSASSGTSYTLTTTMSSILYCVCRGYGTSSASSTGYSSSGFGNSYVKPVYSSGSKQVNFIAIGAKSLDTGSSYANLVLKTQEHPYNICSTYSSLPNFNYPNSAEYVIVYTYASITSTSDSTSYSISYGITFSETPKVLVCCGDSSGSSIGVYAYSVTTSLVYIRMSKGTKRVNVIAIGKSNYSN